MELLHSWGFSIRDILFIVAGASAFLWWIFERKTDTRYITKKEFSDGYEKTINEFTAAIKVSTDLQKGINETIMKSVDTVSEKLKDDTVDRREQSQRSEERDKEFRSDIKDILRNKGVAQEK